jgi:hypothetical protein
MAHATPNFAELAALAKRFAAVAHASDRDLPSK